MVNQGGVEMRIAIIEDDEITRLELSKLLNTQGYETVLLTDFGNLTEELKQYSIELVLLDINLPYENGYEVCRKIKQAMPVPIIFVTSRDTNADELKSIQVGGIDFITKPYDTLILLEKIKRALQLSNPSNFRELVKKDCTLDLHLSILKYQEQSIELTRNATGMGLYLSKKLCDRLGLKLDIASTEKEYTRLTITFPKGTVHNFSE